MSTQNVVEPPKKQPDPDNFDRWKDVPVEWRERVKYFCEVHNAQSQRLIVRAYIEAWEAGPTHIELINAIVDSSERHPGSGVVFKEQWSLHDSFVAGGMIVWICSSAEGGALPTE